MVVSFNYHDYDYLISIDFGTTFTGCCYTYTGDIYTNSSRIHFNIIKNWPKQKNNYHVKTPSAILYDKTTNQLKAWGKHAVDIENKKHSRKASEEYQNTALLTRFKLYLQSKRDPKTGELMIKSPPMLTDLSVQSNISFERLPNDSNISSNSDRPVMNHNNISSVTSAQESPIDCVPFIAAYLREVNKHICEEIKKQNPMRCDPEKFRYIMTVPAKWGEFEKRDMRKAAIDAGIIAAEDHENRLSIITESHAATLFCEWELKSRFEFKKGQRYVVCDAGGGTVDLEIHEVLDEEEARSKNYKGGTLTRCKLATKGNERSGSTFLDQRMEEFILNQFDGHVGDSEMYEIMNDFIERVKPSFGEDDEEENDVYLTLPTGLPNLRPRAEAKIEGGRLIIKHWVFQRHIFDPVVNKILNLLREQINKAYADIDGTFLLGGFGKSPYLRKTIKQKLSSHVGKLMVPDDGDLAAMKGAILYGVNMPRMLNKPVIRLDSFYDHPSSRPHEVLICIDLGLETASCSFTFLHEFNGMGHTIDVTEWPGNEKGVKYIPTRVSYSLYDRDEFNWGAEAKEDGRSGYKVCPIYSTNHETAFHDYLRFLHEFVCRKIGMHSFISSHYTDRSLYRYCISYVEDGPYKKTSHEMKNYAILAGLVERTDSPKRLLLIPRSDAYTMYCEKMTLNVDHHFLRCDLTDGKCTMDVYESVKSTSGRKTTVNHIWSNQTRLLPIRDYMRRYLLKKTYFVKKGLREADSIGNTEVESILKQFDETIIPIFSNNKDLNPGSYRRNERHQFELSKPKFLNRLFKDADDRIIEMTGEEIITHVYKPAFKDLLNKIKQICIDETTSLCTLDTIFIQGDFCGCYPYLDQKNLLEDFSKRNGTGPLKVLTNEIMKHTYVRGALSYGCNHMIWTRRIATYTYHVKFRTFPEPEPEPIYRHIIDENTYDDEDTVSSIYSESNYDNGLSLSAHPDQEQKPIFLNIFKPDNSNSRRKNEILENETFVLLLEGTPITISRGDSPFAEKRFELKGYGQTLADIYRYKQNSREEPTKVHQFSIVCKKHVDFVVSVIIAPTSIQIGCKSVTEGGFKEPNYISDEPILLEEHQIQ